MDVSKPLQVSKSNLQLMTGLSEHEASNGVGSGSANKDVLGQILELSGVPKDWLCKELGLDDQSGSELSLEQMREAMLCYLNQVDKSFTVSEVSPEISHD